MSGAGALFPCQVNVGSLKYRAINLDEYKQSFLIVRKLSVHFDHDFKDFKALERRKTKGDFD